MSRRLLVSASIVVSTLSFMPVAFASATVNNVTVSGNIVTADVDVGATTAFELTLYFENASGLSASSLGLSASTVSPTDPALLARLPSGVTPSSLAVKLAIEPPAGGGLSFRGLVGVDVYTHQLTYTSTTTLRLFSAHAGGDFEDITSSVSNGSYRARGNKGRFSEFLIVDDGRSKADIVAAKFDRLDAYLTANRSGIVFWTFGTLTSLLRSAQLSWLLGDTLGAIASLESLQLVTRLAAGLGIGNQWSAATGTDSVAGTLRSLTETLIFTLAR